MKAEELRIGNLVYDTKGQINSIDLQALSYIVKEPKNQVKPITLTEEWAVKLGFDIPKGGISYDKGLLSLYFGDTILSNKEGRTYWNSWAILEQTPKYVHQLQNLYYALTGYELILKSKKEDK